MTLCFDRDGGRAVAGHDQNVRSPVISTPILGLG
jgi:hypothetical protein